MSKHTKSSRSQAKKTIISNVSTQEKMAIFNSINKISSLKRPAFLLPKSQKKYTSLDEDESSCMPTTTRKQAHLEGEIPTTTTDERRVSFSAKASVREIIRAKDLSEDPNELWYSPSEYKRISQKALSIVRSVDKGSHQVEGKRLCSRGLERHLAASKSACATIRDEAWSSVLEEQSMQLATGEKYNDVRISDIYMEFSIESQLAAHKRALSDAREAQKYTLRKSS